MFARVGAGSVRPLIACAVTCLLWSLVAVSVAQAAFPGRNGLLAVQPLVGRGLLLVGVSGHHPRRICGVMAACRRPLDPRFSPDGRSLIFSSRLGIRTITTTGTCLDCRFVRGSSAAFAPGGTLVTFVSRGRVVEDGIDGLRRAVLLAPAGHLADGVEQAAWSRDGRLAVTSAGRGWIWSHGRLRSLGAAASVSWAPGGRRLAIARHGWVSVVSVKRRHARRLARGSAPAFSPDGRWVAFIGPRHRLEVIRSTGGRARRVGAVTGRSVDWQPLPRHRPVACVPPPGSQVIARSARAIVTTAFVPNAQAQFANSATMGCLTADGREHLLEKDTFNNYDTTTRVALAAVNAPYAALVSVDRDEHYDDCSDSTSVFDLRTGRPTGHGGEASECGEFGGIVQVVVGRDGVSAVRVDGGPGPAGADPIGALTCASASLCISSGFGSIDVTTNPVTSPWTSSPIATLGSASCPTASLCVGVSNSTIYTSTDPTGGPSAWSAAELPDAPHFTAISCPTTSLCVATTIKGDIAISTDPTGGATAWTIENIDGDNQIYTIDCPSASECLAGDFNGNIITSANPTGGSSAWSAQRVAAGPPGILSISCPSQSMCAAIDQSGPFNPDGGILTSTDPAAGQWTLSPVANNPVAVDCPSTSLCVAAGAANTIEISTAPESGTWSDFSASDAAGDLTHIACPTTTLCVAAGDGAGDALVSTNPAAGPNAWAPVLADPVACPPSQRCGTEKIIASDRAGVHTVDSSTEFEAQTGPQLTDLALSGDTLSWLHSGAPGSATLFP